MASFQDDAVTKQVNSLKSIIIILQTHLSSSFYQFLTRESLIAIVQALKRQITMAPRGQLAERVDTDPLKRQLQKLSSITGPTPSSYSEIDSIGTDLWNTCRLTLCSRVEEKREHIALSRGLLSRNAFLNAIISN